MINLLPPDEKSQLRAARTNALLISYNFFLLGAVAYIGLALIVTFVFLNSFRSVYEQTF